MPTVLRHDGYRFYFYSHEPGEPPHVHVDRAGATAKIWLQPIMVASSISFAARDLRDVLWIVRTNRLKLLEAWHDFFDAGTGG